MDCLTWVFLMRQARDGGAECILAFVDRGAGLVESRLAATFGLRLVSH